MGKQYLVREETLTTMADNIRLITGETDTMTVDEMNAALANAAKTHITSVKDFGAVGDGATDDTEAINLAINNLADGGTLYFPSGVYIVNHGGTNYTSAITVTNKTNIAFKLDNGAKIKHSLTNSSYYRIVEFKNCNCVEVFGGTIEGEADEHTNREVNSSGDLTNLSSFCLKLTDCNNVYIHDIVTTNCYGDGIGVSTSSNSIPQLENILIESCSVHDHIRNGIVYSGVKNGTIRNCHIYNIAPNGSGTSSGCLPMCGIDLEPHYSATNENITIDGCHIHDCGKYTIIHSAGTYGSFIRDCNLTGTVTTVSGADNLTAINTTFTTLFASKNTTIRGCTFNGILVADDKIDYAIKVYDTVFTGALRATSAGNLLNVFNVTSADICFYNCIFNHVEGVSVPSIYFYNCTPTLNFERCKFHIWDSGNVDFMHYSNYAASVNFKHCSFIAESETMNQRMIRTMWGLTLVNNIFDMTKVTTYNQSAVVVVGSAKSFTTLGNIFLSKALDAPLCTNVFGCANMTVAPTIIGNNAPTWSGISTVPSNTSITPIIKNNITLDTPNFNNTETWTLTLDDGTVLTKEVVVK